MDGEKTSLGLPRWLVLTLLVLCALLWWAAHRNSAPLAATSNGTGVADACHALMVPGPLDDAMQTEQSAPPFRLGNATITPMAGFSVAARVLSREDYHFGRESQYSPTDLALGWGPMSAEGMAERLNVSQGGRWYRYQWSGDGPPMPPAQIALNSANMHMVPADSSAASALAHVHAGELVRVDGWLVRIDSDDGWHWKSSMSRGDVGAGACELVLVCSLSAR